MSSVRRPSRFARVPIRRAGRIAAAVALLGACGAGAPASAQRAVLPIVQVSTGVRPDTVTVGDRFRVAIRVVTPAGATVRFPAQPQLSPALQPLDSVRVATTAPGEHRATYTLVAWQTGELPPPELRVRVALSNGDSATYPIRLPLPAVASVLPADTAGLEPRPARGVLAMPRRRNPWPIVVVGVLLFGVGIAAAWLWRRRSRNAPPVHSPADPRRDALAALDRARELRLVEAGEWKVFYSLVSETLRAYATARAPGWGVEHTTAELLGNMRGDGVAADAVESLGRVLREADRVKFARMTPTAADAEAAWRAARAWVADGSVLATPAEPAVEQVA